MVGHIILAPCHNPLSALLWLDMSPWVWLITNTLRVPSCQRGLLPINFSLFSVISRPASKVLYTGCTATSSNAEKTKVLPVASASHLSSVGRDSADIGAKRISFKSSVRNLGVHLNQTLSMQQHTSNVCRTAYLGLRRIDSIRYHTWTAQLVSSAITSRLDYCNSVLVGLPLKQISHLQSPKQRCKTRSEKVQIRSCDTTPARTALASD